ncbi:MAG TPA: hypothetical protein VLD19_17570 [Chitinophagaceae bacterium]|nr:hypothetical protein [Chitinophagaceae bacterium]
MVILQIEHKVPDFDGWKKAFERDPIDRKKAGVRRFSIFRPVDDPHYVIIHLVFDTLAEAEKALAALRNLWQKVEGKVMMNPQTRMFDLVENTSLSAL